MIHKIYTLTIHFLNKLNHYILACSIFYKSLIQAIILYFTYPVFKIQIIILNSTLKIRSLTNKPYLRMIGLSCCVSRNIGLDSMCAREK